MPKGAPRLAWTTNRLSMFNPARLTPSSSRSIETVTLPEGDYAIKVTALNGQEAFYYTFTHGHLTPVYPTAYRPINSL